MLSELAVMRFIDREQAKIVARFRSTTRANVRLLALTRTRLLNRLFLGTAAGGAKAIYALSSRGAKAIGMDAAWHMKSQNGIRPTDHFVSHQLVINEIYCDLKYRAIPVPNVQFARWASFRKPIDTAFPLIPDGYVELLHDTVTIASFLEIDLGNEVLSTWKTKISNYLQYAVSGRFQTQFGPSQFRVLVIANSERRMQSIRSLAAALTEKVFWFSTLDTVQREGFWTSVWLRPKESQRQTLL